MFCDQQFCSSEHLCARKDELSTAVRDCPSLVTTYVLINSEMDKGMVVYSYDANIH